MGKPSLSWHLSHSKSVWENFALVRLAIPPGNRYSRYDLCITAADKSRRVLHRDNTLPIKEFVDRARFHQSSFFGCTF